MQVSISKLGFYPHTLSYINQYIHFMDKGSIALRLTINQNISRAYEEFSHAGSLD
ncbi:MAG: hypothetical protein LBU32_00990 [Clostridiales bacterium]|jgi:hypothetical protein|nr:hypothetical protein [Clostridiales bacterium]